VSADPDDARGRLFRVLRNAGFGCRAGRRFDHVGANVTIGASVRLITSLCRRAFGPSVTTIGFGLAAEHAPLLHAVDRAFVLHEDGRAPCLDLLRIADTEKVTQPGIGGWAATVRRLTR
jgi:predicted mannosyl-3-phosphoglycerate phosphatase (HAD superfamily)